MVKLWNDIKFKGQNCEVINTAFFQKLSPLFLLINSKALMSHKSSMPLVNYQQSRSTQYELRTNG
jgi:hypothetical protein